jgi:hypothetical protein
MGSGASTSEALLIAIAGGAVGVLLTGIAWAVLRLSAVPGELTRHDFEAWIVNQDLELFAADEYRRVKQELAVAEGEERRLGGRVREFGLAYGERRASIKSAALHRWRDRLHEAERELVALQSSEGWIQRLLREHWKSDRKGLDLPARERVEPIIEELRQQVQKHGQPAIHVFDPTKFQLNDLLRVIKEHPLEPSIPPRVEWVSDGGGGGTYKFHDNPGSASPDIPGMSGPIAPDESA